MIDQLLVPVKLWPFKTTGLLYITVISMYAEKVTKRGSVASACVCLFNNLQTNNWCNFVECVVWCP